MANRGKEIEGVIVEIFGEEYRIGGEPGEVQQVADYVDGKMREIAETHDGKLPKAQVAILAAMEVSAELFGIMKDRTEFAEKAHSSIDRLTKLVEERANISSAPVEGPPPVEQRLRDQTIRLDGSTSAPADSDRLGDRSRLDADEAADESTIEDAPRLRDPSAVS